MNYVYALGDELTDDLVEFLRRMVMPLDFMLILSKKKLNDIQHLIIDKHVGAIEMLILMNLILNPKKRKQKFLLAI